MARAARYETSRINQAAASSDSILTMLRLGYGAATAWLMFAGADSLSIFDDQAWSSIDLASLQGIAEAVLAGPMSGAVLLLGAVALFIAAGKSISRVIGLGIVAAALTLNSEGVNASDVATFFHNFGSRLASAASAFLGAQV